MVPQRGHLMESSTASPLANRRLHDPQRISLISYSLQVALALLRPRHPWSPRGGSSWRKPVDRCCSAGPVGRPSHVPPAPLFPDISILLIMLACYANISPCVDTFQAIANSFHMCN